MTDLVRAPGPVVMGVLNVTPDSFSDGGRYADLEAAVGHGVRLRDAGAHLVDIGGESTRPGAERIDAATEVDRVLPVIRELTAAGVAVSIDTSRARVAEAALAAGAAVVNDVSGGLADPDMARVVRDAHCPWVLMHWRGHSRTMRELATYTDVVVDVRAELAQRIDAALSAGVAADRLVVDPGLGFAKTAAHNWELSARLPELLDLGYPLLFGASRKSYLGGLLAAPDGTPRPTAEREAATVATSVLAVAAGAWGVRVHDVRATADALAVWAATGSPRLAGAHHDCQQGARHHHRQEVQR
ncbi:dihydropteroate synthase [Micromonospora zamorensis]|uniref:dihydropteroate synthase n=1 Tax=Micromonospora zamorensis TaxID=709883 RepID=UPI003CEDC799